MNTINSFNLKGKRVLLRADINSDVKNGKVLMSERIRQSAETIKTLKRKKAKIVIIAHQGRKGSKDYTSLKQHAELLSKYIKVSFVDDILGNKAEKAINELKEGEAVLLENIRSLEDEFKPGKNKIVRRFSELCDFYINDAFSVSHRKQTSVVSLPRYMKSCAGPLLYNELKALEKIKVKNAVYVLAGSKPEDNLKLLGKGNTVLSGGVFALLCLVAKGYKLGNHEKLLREKYSDFDSLIKKLKPKMKNVLVPEDFAFGSIDKASFGKGKRKEVSIDELPVEGLLPDIGSKTLERYSEEIKKAKAVYMKGPVGMAEYKKFSKGTEDLLKAISKAKGFSLIGGGHLSSAINRLKISKKKFGHLSLSGGALLRYVAGEKLPGVEVLR